MKTIFTVGAVVLATCLLSGCVNEQKVNQLASNVQTLNALNCQTKCNDFLK